MSTLIGALQEQTIVLMTYIDVRVQMLSKTEQEKAIWRELFECLAKAQRQKKDPDSIVLEYFGVEVIRSECVRNNTNDLDVLFRKSLHAFRALYEHNYLTKQAADSCDLLISMVGFSLEPVMHTVLTLRPKNLLFVFSKESARFRPRVKTLDYLKAIIECHGDDYDPKIEEITLDGTDTALVFSAVHNAIAQTSGGGGVAIDVTGGKKSMDVSAFLAASLFKNVAIYYVDYVAYDSVASYPIWGSEFLNELDNPYKLFNVREEHLISKFWGRGDFAAVRVLAEMMTKALTPEMAKRYSLMGKSDRLVEIGKAAACYDAWRRFDYKSAIKLEFERRHQHHDNVLEELGKCSEVFDKDKIRHQASAEIALLLAMDRYMRGKDATEYCDWNKSALCYAQSVEVLLRFCCMKNWSTLKHNRKCFDEGMMLGELKKILFDDNDYFGDPSLGQRLYSNINDIRNRLSHFQCFPVQAEYDYGKIMMSMMAVVDELLKAFVWRFTIDDRKIAEYKKYLTFCSISDNLELFNPVASVIIEKSDSIPCV